jgi:hypothetical protein
MSEPQESKVIDSAKKYDTVVSSGQSALNALLTVNSGATLTFLTLIGHLLEKRLLTPGALHILVGALEMFISSIGLAVISYGAIFFTNCLSSVGWRRSSNAMFAITVVSGLASVVCFYVASRSAVAGLTSLSQTLLT